eukprot:16037-Pyramimonas_sp.AAC.1
MSVTRPSDLPQIETDAVGAINPRCPTAGALGRVGLSALAWMTNSPSASWRSSKRRVAPSCG